MKYIYAVFAISALMLSLTACGTVHGFGHDVSSTGHAISRAAN